MTEAEWIACNDPKPMLEFLQGKVSERKLRLFACACCRHTWHLLVHEVSRHAVEVAERYADGQATEDEQYTAYQEADDVWQLLGKAFDEGLLQEDPSFAERIRNAGVHPFAAPEAADSAVAAVEDFGEDGAVSGAFCTAATAVAWASSTGDTPNTEAEIEERIDQTLLLFDIFGNPFRPITINTAWLTPTVLSLAQAAYENRHLPSGILDIARLAILADALEDAGCNDSEILSHLRSAGPHVRGCFALDLLLGKE